MQDLIHAEAQQLEPVTKPSDRDHLGGLGKPFPTRPSPHRLSQTPEAGGIEAGDDQAALGAKHPIGLAQNQVGLFGKLQHMRQDHQID